MHVAQMNDVHESDNRVPLHFLLVVAKLYLPLVAKLYLPHIRFSWCPTADIREGGHQEYMVKYHI